MKSSPSVPGPFPRGRERYLWGIVSAFFILPPAMGSPEQPLSTFAAPWWSGLGLVILSLLGCLFFRDLRSAGWIGARQRPASKALACLGLYLVFVGNHSLKTVDDNTPNRHIGATVLSSGHLDLGALVADPRGPIPYYLVRAKDQVLSRFPLGTGLLTVPYAAAGLIFSNRPPSESDLEIREKHSAALMALLSVCLFFSAIRRRFGDEIAWPTSGILALATPMVSSISQGLWSFSGEILLLCLALTLLLPEPATRWRLLSSGLCLAGAFACRPTSILPTLALCSWAVMDRKRRALNLLLGTAVGHIAVGWFYFALYGHPLGAYGELNLRGDMWEPARWLSNLAGLAVSPSRGVLIYFPWLLAIPFAVGRLERASRKLWIASTAGALGLVFLSATYSKWWGGFSLGPRLPADAFPFFAVSLLPVLRDWRQLGKWRSLVLGAILLSAATQIASIYNWRAFVWNSAADPDRHPGVLWSLRNSQLAATWIPDWQLSLPAIQNVRQEITGSVERWVRLDLRGVANTRYDRDCFVPEIGQNGLASYPRLDPAILNKERALFHFASKGVGNAITTCGMSATRIPLTPSLPRAIDLVVAADQVIGHETNTTVAVVRAYTGRDADADIELRLNEDVLAYQTHLRPYLPGPHKLYAGGREDPDALMMVRLPVDLSAPVEWLEIRPGDASRPCVCVVAVTLELPDEVSH